MHSSATASTGPLLTYIHWTEKEVDLLLHKMDPRPFGLLLLTYISATSGVQRPSPIALDFNSHLLAQMAIVQIQSQCLEYAWASEQLYQPSTLSRLHQEAYQQADLQLPTPRQIQQ